MQQELFIAIFTGLIVMLGWGFADFFAKKTVDEVGSIVSLVWAHLFGCLFFFLIALYQVSVLGLQIKIPATLFSWGGLMFFGTLQMVVYLFVYEGFGKGKLSLLNPVFASYSGIVALLSVLFFGEILGSNLIIALTTIFGGILLLNLDTAALKIRRLSLNNTPGLKEVAIAALLAAFWTIYWDIFVSNQDWLSYALFMYIFMTVAAFIIAKIKRVNLSVVKPKLWKFLILIGLGETLAYLALSLGLSVTSYTSIVILIAGAFSLPTLILSHFFLKEKITKLQRIGGIVIILGIMILALY